MENILLDAKQLDRRMVYTLTNIGVGILMRNQIFIPMKASFFLKEVQRSLIANQT